MAREPVPPTSLPSEINAATRTLHTNLNRLITSRLPLGLPPYAFDSSPYTTGLLYFAHIFLTFESLWNDLLPDPACPPTSPLLSFLLVNPYDAPDMFSTPPSPRMLEFLQTLRPKGLARSGRLKQDLEFLTGLHATDFSVLLASYPGEKVQEYCSHIRRVVRHKPHVLVAYAWCFYMAVFSGGRWIRSELYKGGEDFWRRGTLDEKAEATGGQVLPHLKDRGLSFWHFPGDEDGEDIKREFRQRLVAAEVFFTSDERVDVIEEAKEIFKRSAVLVEELDEKLATDLAKINHVKFDTEAVAGATTKGEDLVPKSHAEVIPWFKRPEATGAAIALGCLACVAVLRLDLAFF